MSRPIVRLSSDPATSTIAGVEILRTGTWNGRNYTTEDFDNMVASFNALKDVYEPPGKLGHNEEQALLANDGLPAVGWVSGLKRVGDKLLADFRDVPAKFAKLVEVGAYRKRSAEIWFNVDLEGNGKKWPAVLRAVSWLGADPPAVKGLQDVYEMYSDPIPAETPVSVVTLADDSYEFRRTQVWDALKSRYPMDLWMTEEPLTEDEMAGPSCMIRDLYEDRVVVNSIDGLNLFQIDYSIGDDGVVSLGDTPVKVKVEYSPTGEPPTEETQMADILKDANNVQLAHKGEPILRAIGDIKDSLAGSGKNKKGVGQARAAVNEAERIIKGIKWDEEEDSDEEESKAEKSKKEKEPAGAKNSDATLSDVELRSILGIDESADIKATLIERQAQHVSLSDYNDLRAQVAALSHENAESKARKMIDQAKLEGKLAPAQEDWAMKYCLSDAEGFEAYLASVPKNGMVKLGESGKSEAPGEPGGVKTPTPAALEVARQLGVAEERLTDTRTPEERAKEAAANKA